jgi:L-iditol 2-dehydrogenase
MSASKLPQTTRAAVYEQGGTVSVRELAIAAPSAGELLVRITACGLCGSEALRWYADKKAPFVLGHEPVGRIVACGEDAATAGGATFAPGERVFIHHHAPCMHCRRCKRGDYVQCATWRPTRISPGALSEYAIVQRESVLHDVLRVPADLSDEQATLIEPLGTVVKSVRRSGLRSGDRVLVIGLGAMGMLHALVARKAGAELVLGADRIAARLERAGAFGIDAAWDGTLSDLRDRVRERTGGDGAEIVFVTPGSQAALDAAAACVARGGTIVSFTPMPPQERWPIDQSELFFRDVSIVTSYSAGPGDTREALALLEGGLAVAPLFTHRFDLAAAAEAYALLQRPDAALKILVTMSPSSQGAL